jgi:predicted O-methyltransferase YrrM
VPPAAPHVPQALLEGAQLLCDRVELLRRLPRGGIVAELGTETGGFAARILEVCEPAHLDVVDVDFSRCRDDVLANPAVTAHRMLTTAFLSACDDDRYDWIYVDADHGYRAVRADIEAARSKVKPGGLLVFNDFARIIRPGLGAFGVHQAVTEFIAEHRWPVVFFAMHGEALYDIAVRRPI